MNCERIDRIAIMTGDGSLDYANRGERREAAAEIIPLGQGPKVDSLEPSSVKMKVVSYD